jgi:hypothetical protein
MSERFLNFLAIPAFCAKNGVAPEFVQAMIASGKWKGGKQWFTMPDGTIVVNPAGPTNVADRPEPERKVRRRPMKAETALYRHWAADGALLYVGISNKPLYRLDTHMEKSSWARHIASVTIEWLPDREAALAAEMVAIRSEGPRHNLAGALKVEVE